MTMEGPCHPVCCTGYHTGKARQCQLTKHLDSVYFPLNEAFQAHLYRKPDGMTPDQYAVGVVKELLKKSPAAWFWWGASTGLIRSIDAFLPRTFWVCRIHGLQAKLGLQG